MTHWYGQSNSIVSCCQLFSVGFARSERLQDGVTKLSVFQQNLEATAFDLAARFKIRCRMVFDEWHCLYMFVLYYIYASKNLCVVWVPSNFVPMDFLITPRWWWPFGFCLEWKITTDFLVITWVPSQANDRSIVDMHQKLTANDERPWAEDGWGQCSTRWVVMGTSTTLPRSSTANLLLVNLDISRHQGHIWIRKNDLHRQGLHQLAIQTAKDIEESPTPQIVAKWLRTGTLRLVTNRSKWIQHDSTGSIKKC